MSDSFTQILGYNVEICQKYSKYDNYSNDDYNNNVNNNNVNNNNINNNISIPVSDNEEDDICEDITSEISLKHHLVVFSVLFIMFCIMTCFTLEYVYNLSVVIKVNAIIIWWNSFINIVTMCLPIVIGIDYMDDPEWYWSIFTFTNNELIEKRNYNLKLQMYNAAYEDIASRVLKMEDEAIETDSTEAAAEAATEANAKILNLTKEYNAIINSSMNNVVELTDFRKLEKSSAAAAAAAEAEKEILNLTQEYNTIVNSSITDDYDRIIIDKKNQ